MASHFVLTVIRVMTMIIPLADAKARLSEVLDDVWAAPQEESPCNARRKQICPGG